MPLALPLPLTVLVADDAPDLRHYGAGCLGRDVRVHEAADGTSALALARAVHPDVVISDVRRPGLDGFELRAALHADAATAAIPVLVISGARPAPPADARASSSSRDAGDAGRESPAQTITASGCLLPYEPGWNPRGGTSDGVVLQAYVPMRRL